MNRFSTLCAFAVAFAAAAPVLTATAEAKVCSRNAVCAESTDDGRTVNVYLTTTKGFTHFNVLRNGRQVESRGRYSFEARPGYDQFYSVQACVRGSFLQASHCTSWQRYKHVTRAR